MYRLLVPLEKGKSKSIIRGFWKDNNILYYDYLKALELPYMTKNVLDGIGKTYNELALFYMALNKGFIYTCRTGKTETLKKVKRISHTGYKGLKKAIQGLIKSYGGVTVYNKGKYYLLECFYNN